MDNLCATVLNYIVSYSQKMLNDVNTQRGIETGAKSKCVQTSVCDLREEVLHADKVRDTNNSHFGEALDESHQLSRSEWECGEGASVQTQKWPRI